MHTLLNKYTNTSQQSTARDMAPADYTPRQLVIAFLPAAANVNDLGTDYTTLYAERYTLCTKTLLAHLWAECQE